ncbi:OmpA family protein [Aquirufa antheringensis]|uniref:OmpA family protein n=1 Tax=Aquirufa antheringensis TaxID=2516559 RepID=UPI0010328970|nr:OmpA family protein [Aquirufa antheringensis]TBH69888.1 flagellar motor protein MotB [Aquirufa antheringensis]
MGVRICILLIFVSTLTLAQKVKWASQVISVSSEYKDPLLGREYRALHALGRPSKYPKMAATPSAWQSMTADSPEGEYLLVGFDTTMAVKQIAIFENFGAGSITSVDGLDQNNRIYPLRFFAPGYATAGSQVTTIRLPTKTSFKLKGIKISFNSLRVKGYSQIDAIGISDSDEPIESSLKLTTDANAFQARENLGNAINSKFNEICPVVSPDGQKLYFTRWKHPDNLGANKNQDIWVSNWQPDRTWSKATLFPAPINNDENNAVCGITPNGKTLLLNNVYGKDGTMEKGVSFSFLLRTGEWSFPKALKIVNFKNKSEFSEYTLAPNGKVLLMTTETKDSYGGKDIYVSFLNADDSWSEPKNIGPVVNTGEAESTPFIAPDGVTMYFSSSGHVGYGNNDIFLSRRLDDTWQNWSAPENLGPIVNTPQWDGYFSVSAKGDFAYFSSTENSMGAEDIFRIKIPEKAKPLTLIQLTGQVINQKTKEPMAAHIVIKAKGNPSDTLSLDYDPYGGDYSFMWPAKKAFTVQIKKPGFFSKVENFDFTSSTSFQLINRNFFLQTVEKNKAFAFSNVSFDQGKSELKPGFEAELEKIISILSENTQYALLLEGHTDNQGDWNDNLKLSIERVENVKAYLVSKGVDANRIQTKGWGGSKPLANNLLEDTRKSNRRVEFTLIPIE